MQTNRAELITPEYYKTETGPPPPYELVVQNWPDKSVMDAPPPWKEAWGLDDNQEKQDDCTARPDSCVVDVEQNGEGAEGGKTNEQACGEELSKTETPGSVEILKAELNNGSNSTGLPSYEATMKLETTGYF